MSASPTALVILLHGVGSNGQDMMQLGNIWQSALPDVAFAAPNAPQAAGFGGGYQWFSIAGITQDNRPARIQAARTAFDAIIQQELATHGFTAKLDRVIFVGFSQGSMMLLDAVASGRWSIAGAVAFSGRLAAVPPLKPATTPLLLIHGDADQVVPVGESVQAEKILRELGADVTAKIYTGLAHTISTDGAALALDFIKTKLA
eukprot:gene12763-12860_t